MGYKEHINAYVDSHKEEMLALWKEFVDTPSQARDRQAAHAFSLKLKAILEEMDFSCHLINVGETNAPAVMGI